MPQAKRGTSHPFTKDTADIILRASDGTEFRVHKLVLAEASSVFADMFTIPQPPPSPDTSAAPDAGGESVSDSPVLPSVDLTETSETVERLLRFCYPMADPVLELDEIGPIVHAARKYDMKWALSRVGKLLTQRAILDDPKQALRAFTVASNLDLPEAEEAARATLREPLGSDLPYELNGISPSSLYRLLDYRRRVHAAAVQYLMDPTGWHSTYIDSFSLDEWSFPDNGEYKSAIILPARWCQVSSDGEECYQCRENEPYYYEYDLRAVPPHVRIDEPYVLRDLAKQIEGLHNASSLQFPAQLLSDTFCMLKCDQCRREGLKALRDIFAGVEKGLRDVMMKVPLDDLGCT